MHFYTTNILLVLSINLPSSRDQFIVYNIMATISIVLENCRIFFCGYTWILLPRQIDMVLCSTLPIALCTYNPYMYSMLKLQQLLHMSLVDFVDIGRNLQNNIMATMKTLRLALDFMNLSTILQKWCSHALLKASQKC